MLEHIVVDFGQNPSIKPYKITTTINNSSHVRKKKKSNKKGMCFIKTSVDGVAGLPFTVFLVEHVDGRCR